MFINSYSWKCLLGTQAKEIKESDGIYTWKVGKRNHLVADRKLTEADLATLKEHTPCNFNYMSKDNVAFLKKYCKITTSADRSVVVDLENFSLDGGEFKKTRQSFNKCKKNNLTVESNFRKLKDVEDMVEEWSNDYTDKYFRDFSGKNYYFYKNNFHQDCINIFIYHQDALVAFSTLSPNQNGNSVYIIGKALYKRFAGISEYADIVAYQQAIASGVKKIDMGQAPKNLLKYKMKYPGASIEVSYDGKILEVI